MSSRNIPIGVLAAQLLSSTGAGDGGDGGDTDTGGTVTGAWTFDPRYLDADHSLSEDNQRVTNDTGSIDNNPVHTFQTLLKEDSTIYYWEVEVVTGDASQSGEVGVCDAQNLPDSTGDLGDKGGLGYRGTGGQLVGSGITGLESYGSGDVVMLAFRPSTGEFWCGVNGVWNADPDTDPANATATAEASFWRVSINASDSDASKRLVSETANFNYTPPAVCTSLEEAPQTAELRIESMSLLTIETPIPKGNLAVKGMRLITIVEE